MSWQNALATFSFALLNGGTGGFFFSYIYALFAFASVYLTLAELSSSYPTAGGQYQWVAQMAPVKWRKVLSYCVGWLCSLAWLGYLASCGVIIGNMVKDCGLIYHHDSTVLNSQWFPTIVAVAALILGGLFNGKLTRIFPALEGVVLVIHFSSWLAFIVTLWVKAPHGKPREVLLTFNNGGGWASPGAASLIGVLTACSALIGYDSAVHMSKLSTFSDCVMKLTLCHAAENAQDASYTIPWSLIISYGFNACMAFVAGVTVIFCAGDLNEVLADVAQAPFVTIFLNATGSKGGTLAMLIFITICFMSSMLSEVATASRQIWAFAREYVWSRHSFRASRLADLVTSDGLPFSHKLKQVCEGGMLPAITSNVSTGTG